MASSRPNSFLRRFITNEASGGIVLMAAAALALALANSPLAEGYFGLLGLYIGPLSVLHWINDALMAVFFLLVGLEIKREAVGGQLATWSRRALPGLAALGGMTVPALLYLSFNASTPETVRGWAIPAATDIAFALGVLSLLGRRVPISLKVFLAALAIIDDLGAVLIIALFYTAELDVTALLGAAAVTGVLVGLNQMRVRALLPYLLLGVVLWILVYLSGIHATLAGVVLAMTIPLVVEEPGLQEIEPPLLKLEHAIGPWVAFAVVPIFGFANAGVSFAGFSLASLADPVPIGVAVGLFVGKQVGVFGFAWAAIRLRLAALPDHATWAQLYGTAILCGIGFTMSLFIGLLAFPESPMLQDEVKLGVLMGSLLSGVVGAIVLVLASGRRLPASAVE